jgi:hypothetical protein
MRGSRAGVRVWVHPANGMGGGTNTEAHESVLADVASILPGTRGLPEVHPPFNLASGPLLWAPLHFGLDAQGHSWMGQMIRLYRG